MKWKLTPEAEEAIQAIKDDQEPSMIVVSSDGFWYDITDGGYFRPRNVLSDPTQIEQVIKAIALLRDLERKVYNEIVPEY